MKFDLDELDRGRTLRELRVGQVRRMIEQRSAGAATRQRVGSAVVRGRSQRPQRGPGARPQFNPDEDTMPEFNVTVVLTRQPRGSYTAELVWTAGGASGRFPVVPDAGENTRVRRGMKAREFRTEDEARKVAVQQSDELVNQFIDWALQ